MNLKWTGWFYEDIERFAFKDLTDYEDGGQFYNEFKAYGKDRPKFKKDMVETPFAARDGKPLLMLPPSIAAIDSYSMFQAGSIINIQDGAGIGTSGRNIEAMRDAMAKSQMMLELPRVTKNYGLYFILSAHLGKQYSMDAHAPPKKQLSFLKNDLKLKNVPEKYNFLMNNLWFLFSMKPLINQSTKALSFLGTKTTMSVKVMWTYRSSHA